MISEDCWTKVDVVANGWIKVNECVTKACRMTHLLPCWYFVTVGGVGKSGKRSDDEGRMTTAR